MKTIGNGLVLVISMVVLTITACGSDGYYNEDTACRRNAVAGLERQYKTAAELDSLLDVVCGDQDN